MRINKTNYPMLELLKWHDRLSACPLAKEIIIRGEKGAQALNGINYHWPRLVHLFNKRIDIISRPFCVAAWANSEKICAKENIEALFGDEPLSGTIITRKWVTFYSFDVRDDRNESCIIIFCNHILSLVLLNSFKVFYADPNGDGWDAEVYKEIYKQLQYSPIIYALFKKYAEVEVVDAKMGKKVDIPDSKEKLLWEFDMPATYVDCSWFREIVRKEGFMVRGHFRLQPYKKGGEWTKKLIYIEPFQKHGYTRRAKIELQ